MRAIFTLKDFESGKAQQELDEAAAHGTASDDRWMRRKNGEYFFVTGVTTASTTVRIGQGRYPAL